MDILYIVGLSVVGIVSAPIVVTGALGLVGFGAGGIVAGSTAASMMSSAMIANGEVIASGSLVSIGQSIGAAELPIASKIVVSGVGALVGLAAK